MRFVMVLLDGDDGYVGKCNMLKLISHSSTPVARTGHTHINHHQVRIRAVFFHFHPFHNSIVPKRYLSCWTSLTFTLCSFQQHHGHHPHHAHPQEPAPVHRVEYTLPQVADLRFHRFWNFSSRQLMK